MTSTRLLSPTVANWINSSTMNLLAIELLYLAFSVALNKYPDFIKNNVKLRHTPTNPPLLRNPCTHTQTFGNFNTNARNTFHNRNRTPYHITVTKNQPTVEKTSNGGFHCTNAVSFPSNVPEIDYVDIFKKLVDLQSWKDTLQLLPVDTKRRIWEDLHSIGVSCIS